MEERLWEGGEVRAAYGFESYGFVCLNLRSFENPSAMAAMAAIPQGASRRKEPLDTFSVQRSAFSVQRGAQRLNES